MIKEFPALEITALLRKPLPEFKERYPDVKIVLGDFDSFDVIEKASSEADIVVRECLFNNTLIARNYRKRCANDLQRIVDTGDIDHPGCANAILSGCAKNKRPSFLIHLTGTGCISDEREQTWEGKYNPHVWHDIDDIQEIYDLPASARHHVIDQKIMDASNDKLKTALICPPDIYGQNTGIGSRETFLVPSYIKVLLKVKEAFYLGGGDNIRTVTHIDDVVDLFIILIGEAIKGGGEAQWGREVRPYSSLASLSC